MVCQKSSELGWPVNTRMKTGKNISLPHLVLIIFLLASLAGIVSAASDYSYQCSFELTQSTQTNILMPTESGYNEEIPFQSLLAPASLFAVFLSALIYMLSKFLESPKLELFAKEELAQVIISFVFLLCLGAIFLASCSLVVMVTGASPQNKINNYITYLLNTGDNMIVTLLSNSYNNQLIASKYIYRGTPFAGGSGRAPSADRKTYSSIQEINFDLLLPAMVSLKLQQWLLAVVWSMSISWVLPLGIILRLFPPTRGASDYLLAMAFGLYIVIPLTYVINASVMSGNTFMSSEPTPITTPAVPIASIGTSPNPLVDFGRLAYIYPQAVFFPNISIIIFIAAVNAMARALQAASGVMENYSSFMERYS